MDKKISWNALVHYTLAFCACLVLYFLYIVQSLYLFEVIKRPPSFNPNWLTWVVTIIVDIVILIFSVLLAVIIYRGISDWIHYHNICKALFKQKKNLS